MTGKGKKEGGREEFPFFSAFLSPLSGSAVGSYIVPVGSRGWERLDDTYGDNGKKQRGNLRSKRDGKKETEM
jgi:hypothetical protein